MNNEDIIHSGILELYVLDQLTSTERREVDDARTTSIEINEEIYKIEKSLELLHQDSEVEIPKENLTKILARISPAVPKTIPFSINKYSIAASTIIALLCAMTFYFAQKYYSTDTELKALQNSFKSNESEMQRVKYQLVNKDRELAISTHTCYAKYTLKGTPLSSSSTAIVFWNPNDGTVYSNTLHLPKSPQNKQYQLWAIVDGKPEDLGIIDTINSLQAGKSVYKPQAFAITLEPLGGKTTPTLDQMIVICSL